MEHIINGFKEAINLLISFDQEICSIILLSIWVSFLATFLAALIGVPLGFFLGYKDFRFKGTVARIIYTLMGLPPVVVGLIVAIILSRKGPLGSLGLIFTPTAMIIAQIMLVTPIITGIIFNNSKERSPQIREICLTLGGKRWDLFWLFIKEMRHYILIALVSGFGRAISEVGAVMIVGGNIKGHTRVMTTFITMNNNMGNYATSIAMALVLLTISFICNSILYSKIDGDR
jgi:tungstate transport system permease protein